MHQVLISEKESGQRLDKFLQRYLPAASAGFLYKMLRRKNITVNKKKTEGRYLLRSGDSIELFFSDETLAKFQEQEKAAPAAAETVLDPRAIVFENENLLLVNKPAGVLSQKASKDDVSIAEQVCGWLLDSGRFTEKDMLLYRPGPANRLDRNTSGLMIFPLSAASAREVSDMIRNRSLDKTYLALVQGSFPEEKHMTDRIARDTDSHTSRIVSGEEEGAAAELIARPVRESGGYTLLEVKLLTGKTHQIRTQLAAAGYPLAGDRKYGKIGWDLVNRQFLHSWKTAFPEIKSGVLQPLSGRSFTAPLPEDLAKAAESIGLAADPYR